MLRAEDAPAQATVPRGVSPCSRALDASILHRGRYDRLEKPAYLPTRWPRRLPKRSPWFVTRAACAQCAAGKTREGEQAYYYAHGHRNAYARLVGRRSVADEAVETTGRTTTVGDVRRARLSCRRRRRWGSTSPWTSPGASTTTLVTACVLTEKSALLRPRPRRSPVASFADIAAHRKWALPTAVKPTDAFVVTLKKPPDAEFTRTI